MFKKFDNSRGQIGETMTWMVGTIVIIVILTIAIFIVQFSLSKREFVPYTTNDLIVTKSAVSFLKHNSNFENLRNSIISDDYNLIKPNLQGFLEGISTDKTWDFRIFVNDHLRGNSVISNAPLLTNRSSAYFQFNLGNDEIGLSFDGGKNE